MRNETKRVLEAVRDGALSVDDALLRLKTKPFEDVGFAKIDLHRETRQGVPEVIYGAGKTPEQIIGIIEAMQRNGQERILITRLCGEDAGIISRSHAIVKDERSVIGPDDGEGPK